MNETQLKPRLIDLINEMASLVVKSHHDDSTTNQKGGHLVENFAGADLHKRVTQLALLREGKHCSQYRFRNDPDTSERVLRRLPSGIKIEVEATSMWWWFMEKARVLGHEVFLSHPKQTKAIASARLKSDKVEVPMLGKLLKADLLPMVWIPGERERYVRELLCHRAKLGRARTAGSRG